MSPIPPTAAGRGSPNKVAFIAAVQTSPDGKPQKVCFKAMRSTKAGIPEWAHRAIDLHAVVVSDALPSVMAGLAAEVVRNHAIKTGSGRAAVLHPDFRNFNTVLGNLKTAITGTYHAFDFVRYAHRYLAEAQYRFNRRFDLKSILTRLIHAAAQTSGRINKHRRYRGRDFLERTTSQDLKHRLSAGREVAAGRNEILPTLGDELTHQLGTARHVVD